jgi:hypothetical protein
MFNHKKDINNPLTYNNLQSFMDGSSLSVMILRELRWNLNRREEFTCGSVPPLNTVRGNQNET